MELIKTFLQKNSEKRVRVAIVGDCMVDQYYQTSADRISPEFPIIRFLSPNMESKEVLGGSGNVAVQSKHFNVDSKLFSFHDLQSANVIANSGVDNDGCLTMPDGYNIPVKKRLYDKDFPLCRWDIERPNYGLDETTLKRYQKDLRDKFLRSQPPVDVIILSDYDKGVFSSCKKWWVRDDVPTIVDPKKGPLGDWEGCYIFKPNSKEAIELSGGMTDWKDQCKYFQNVLGCKAVIITHGESGVVGIIDGKFIEYHPKKHSVAESVVGGGDCFCMFLAMAIAHNIDIEEAIVVAYEAGAVYVQKKHNEPITPMELLAKFHPIEAKIISPPCKKDRNYSLVVTNGCYDLMHEGHLSLLYYAKSLGNKLCVLVNSDDSVKKLKGDSRPIIPLKERMKMLASISCVDFVLSFDEETPYNAIKSLQPEILIKGADWAGNIVGSEFADEVVAFPIIPGLSTTKIIERITNATST